jgi:hypothetical protein
LSKKKMPGGVRVNRDAKIGCLPFREVFSGFEDVDAVRSIFLERTEKVLADLMVDLQSRKGYLKIDDETGHVVVSAEYLKTGEERYLYLDVIHELIHIRQFMEGKELFDERYSYVDRPTEIEAYGAAAKEAKRIGMSDDEVVEYLRVEWVTEEEFQRLLVSLNTSQKDG